MYTVRASRRQDDRPFCTSVSRGLRVSGGTHPVAGCGGFTQLGWRELRCAERVSARRLMPGPVHRTLCQQPGEPTASA